MERLTIVGKQNVSSKMDLCDVKISYSMRQSNEACSMKETVQRRSRTHTFGANVLI